MLSRETPAHPLEKPARRIRCELLALGDELLLGLTANGHLAFIGSQLGARGIELRRNVTVTDDAEDIARQLRESLARSDFVLITGGLGPPRACKTIFSPMPFRLAHSAMVKNLSFSS